LQLRRRIEELENRLQQAGTTTDKANKDRDYFLARVADSEKQIRLKDEKLAEVENTLSRSTQQLHDLRQEN
jgi:septal ring factor EnvC (AmiA/AmiB activator)